VRSRWAAVGAAVAVTLGAGGLISVGASGGASSLVPITPTRVLDTRSGDRVGSLDAAGASDPYRLKISGSNGIPASGVTGVSLNVTAVDTETNNFGGFLSVYPCASVSAAKPDVSNMNFSSGQTIANAVTVPVSADGHICLYVYGTAHLLVDVNGFYASAAGGVVDAYTKVETDTKLAAKASSDDLDALVDTVATKADQSDVDSKASSDDLDALVDTVATKADQTDILSKGEASDLLALQRAMQTPTVFTTDTVRDAALAIGHDGKPIIAYTDYDVVVTTCITINCTKVSAATEPDGSDLVGFVTRHLAMAIGNDGNPIIVYEQATSGSDGAPTSMEVLVCTTPTCTGDTTVTTLETSTDVYLYPAIAIGDEGNPVITYARSATDVVNPYVVVVTCSNPDCSEKNTLEIPSTYSSRSAVAIGDDGNPVIAYGSGAMLEVTACLTKNCSEVTTSTLDGESSAAMFSIAIGDNGNPIIAYYDAFDDDLRVAACNNPTCSNGRKITTVESYSNVGEYPSIAIGNNGKPVIAYQDTSEEEVKIAACITIDCTGTPLIKSLAPQGAPVSMAIGVDGNPVVLHGGSVVVMWNLLLPE